MTPRQVLSQLRRDCGRSKFTHMVWVGDAPEPPRSYNQPPAKSALRKPVNTGTQRRLMFHSKTATVILDHARHGPLLDTEVIRRDPPASRTIVYWKRLIERRLEAVFLSHPQIHSREISHSRNDDLRSEGQRRDDDPRSDRAVVGAEWRARADDEDLLLRSTGPSSRSLCYDV